MNFINTKTPIKAKLATIALATIGAGAISGLTIASAIAAPVTTKELLRDVRTAIELRLPKTPITSLTCNGFGGLCEVVSKKTLFYIDERARYLFVGRLYDMESRADLTAAKLLEINPELLVANAARRDIGAQAGANGASKTSVANVPIGDLPASGAIHWGNKAGPKLVVFSDFGCGYCKQLTGELLKARVHVEERPISIFGQKSRKLAEAVICARDPEKALRQAYASKPISAVQPCDTTGLDANEAFARKYGFGGTPVIVRASDGAVIEGFRSASVIRSFARQSKETAK
ncbi:DsbC family protein [Parasphingorhabdus sp.]|uniref:DsbC family protein n=1 Tax=Parasphingorhabdus sp. TaxID=2709688 RepID=UPI003D2BA93E